MIHTRAIGHWLEGMMNIHTSKHKQTKSMECMYRVETTHNTPVLLRGIALNNSQIKSQSSVKQQRPSQLKASI